MKLLYLGLIFWFIYHPNLSAQEDQMPTQAEIEAMMKEAEKQMKEVMEEMSPEEQKMVEDLMDNAKNNVGKIGTSTSDVNTKIPQKQTAILAKLPKITTGDQYHAQLEKLVAKTKISIQENIRNQVEELLSKYNSKEELNNLPPLLFMEKNPKAAVYAALRVAQINKNELLSQNNLAVILHQTGYPQYALPLLDYLISQNPLPNFYNNAGQCYLSLGETKKAEEFFAICLASSPNNFEAHCGTAMILINQGKIPQAIPHVEQAMKLGYSPALDKLISDKKIKLDFDKFKPKVPEYFNPNKYKPPHSAKTLKDVKPVLEERQRIEDLMYAWGDKNRESDEKHADKISHETVMQFSQRTHGIIGNQPFSRKAFFMLNQIPKEVLNMQQQDFTTADYSLIEVAKDLEDGLENKIENRYKTGSFDSAYEECLMKKEETEVYLKESAPIYDQKVQTTVFKYYDITNQYLYWNKYLLNSDGYEHMFYGAVPELFFHLNEYKKFQPLNVAENVVQSCEKILENPPKKKVVVEEEPDPNCPFKVGVNFVVAKGKMDCKGWELEGGELIVLGIQKDFRTGEWTIAIGLGGNLGVPMLVDVGGKGQLFFKFDSEGVPVDTGLTFEAGAEGGVGPIVIEEKATATIGMVSGIHVTGTAAGQETAIFTFEP